MDISWKNCWDCPIPLSTVFVQYALLFLAAAVGAWMLKRRRPGIRELGILVITLTVLWAAAITRAVPRWGILRSDAPFDLFSQRTTHVIFAVLDVALLAVVFVVRRLTSAAQLRHPVSRLRSNVMSAPPYTVAVILDPEAGEIIRDVAARGPVWVSPSPANKRVVDEIRSEAAGSLQSVTLWSSPRTPQSEQEWRSVVGDVDLHHGEYSHEPPVSVIEVFGPQPSDDARAAFSEFGFTIITPTSFGFTASKEADSSD